MDSRSALTPPGGPVVRTLSLGASPVVKVLVGLVGLVALGWLAAIAVWTGAAGGLGQDWVRQWRGPEAGVPTDYVPDGPLDRVTIAGGAVNGFGYLTIACALPVVVVFGFVVLSTLRYRVQLDGSTVAVRGAFRTRRVDLSSALVRGDEFVDHSTESLNERLERSQVTIIPAIAAHDYHTGHKVKIPLRARGSLRRLPPDELRALADAIMSGRPADGHRRQAELVADALRRRADELPWA